jgi:hypothetical protein
VQTAKIVQPELRVESAGVVFDKRELHQPDGCTAACTSSERSTVSGAERGPNAPIEPNAPAPAATWRKSRRDISSDMGQILAPPEGFGGLPAG